MASLSWVSGVRTLQPAALTVLAQALPPNDRGMLLWDGFYTRQNVDSVDLSTLAAIDYRPTADRREWNGNGRRVPIVTPATKQVSMVPIEANFAVDEKEMQKLMERAAGNEAIFRDQIAADIPKRTQMIAMACWRCLELDAMRAWANGTIVQRNPEDASKTFTMSFGFSGSRYTTAGTAWNDSGVNAYDLLQAWIVSAEDLVGPVTGAMMRLASLNAILADAPNLPNDVPMTRTQLEDRIQQDKGGPFQFYVNEQSVDIFDDGGTAYTRTKVWPVHKIAAVPQGEKIGSVAFAPVLRAWEIASEAGPGGKIDVNGVTVYPDLSNAGKRLEIQAQLNALPVPTEQLLFVTDIGV
jgi:hypothetical protein